MTTSASTGGDDNQRPAGFETWWIVPFGMALLLVIGITLINRHWDKFNVPLRDVLTFSVLGFVIGVILGTVIKALSKKRQLPTLSIFAFVGLVTALLGLFTDWISVEISIGTVAALVAMGGSWVINLERLDLNMTQFQPDTRDERTINLGLIFISFLFILGIAVISSYVPEMMRQLKQENIFIPDIALSLLLVMGLIILVSLLTTMAVIFRGLGLQQENLALGLPEGTVRSVIALAFILLFAIISVHIFSELETREETQVVTGAELQKLLSAKDNSKNQVTVEVLGSQTSAIVQIEDGTEPADVSDETLYLVRFREEPSDMQQNVATQILTALGTLVAALASFYFAYRSATQSATAGADGVAEAVAKKIVTEFKASQNTAINEITQAGAGASPEES